MIVFAALIPNSPLLVKRSGNMPEATLAALAQIRAELDTAHPETIVIVSELARSFSSAFALPFATKFVESLKRLGFISRHLSYTPDNELLGRLQSFTRDAHIPLRSVHTEFLDAGSSIALRMLGVQQKKYSIITLGTSDRSLAEHVEFGYAIKDVLHGHSRRIAVIVCGDAGDQSFAHGLISSLADRSVAALTKISSDTSHARDTVSRALAIGYGLLRGFPAQTKLLSDETISDSSLVSAILFTE